MQELHSVHHWEAKVFSIFGYFSAVFRSQLRNLWIFSFSKVFELFYSFAVIEFSFPCIRPFAVLTMRWFLPLLFTFNLVCTLGLSAGNPILFFVDVDINHTLNVS